MNLYEHCYELFNFLLIFAERDLEKKTISELIREYKCVNSEQNINLIKKQIEFIIKTEKNLEEALEIANVYVEDKKQALEWLKNIFNELIEH